MRRSSRSLGPLGTINVVRGEPATERGSIFTAQIAYPISTAAQATAALALMRQEAHCGVADHNMTAYRLAGPKKGSKVTKAYDDDGEAHGGQRLLGCLTKLAACNVANVSPDDLQRIGPAARRLPCRAVSDSELQHTARAFSNSMHYIALGHAYPSLLWELLAADRTVRSSRAQ